MDWGTAIIGLVSIVICALPFVLIYANRSKRRKTLLESLTNLASDRNRTIGESEFCNDFVLGLDTECQHVFFYRQLKEKPITGVIQLNEFQSCQVDKVTRTIEQGNNASTIIKEVALVFVPKKSTSKVERFELFNEAINIQLSGELQCAMKWSNEINRCIEKR